MTIRNKTTRRNDRRGTVAVEFAIILPVILIVFFGSLSLCRLVILRDAVEQAAYEGARRAMVINATASECTQETLGFLEMFGIQGATVDLTPDELAFSTRKVSVTVSVPFAVNAWGGGAFAAFDWQITRTVTLTRNFAL